MNESNDIKFAGDIGRLEGKLDSVVSMVGELKGSFETMEKGRLSKLEVQFATLYAELSVTARNSAAVWAVAASVIASIISALSIYFIKGI